MPRKASSLLFPEAGVSEAEGFQNQPPYTTPGALNVRANAGVGQRNQGGSRPGLVRFFREELGGDSGLRDSRLQGSTDGSYVDGHNGEPPPPPPPPGTGNAVRILTQFREIVPAGTPTFSEPFTYDRAPLDANNPAWSKAVWKEHIPLCVERNYAAAAITQQSDNCPHAGAVYADIEVDIAKRQDIRLAVNTETAGSTFQAGLHAMLDNDDPDATADGVSGYIEVRGDRAHAKIILDVVRNGEADHSEAEFPLQGYSGDLRMIIDPDVGTVTFLSDFGGSLNTAIPTLSGGRVGFSLDLLTQQTDTPGIKADSFIITYEPIGGRDYNRNRVFVVAGGDVYRENNQFNLNLVPSDWDAGDKTLRGMGVDYLGKLYLTSKAGRIGVYTPNSTIGFVSPLEATQGIVPTQQGVCAVFQDRLWVADDKEAPHEWYAARQGDATDWDYSAQDSGGAVSSVVGTAGAVPQPIKALIPAEDDYLLFGCQTSLWIMRGDPRLGGRVENLSHRMGCFDGHSWCRLPDKRIVMLGQNGLAIVEPGGGIIPFSEKRIPNELRGMDPTDTYVSMAYDDIGRGVQLWVTSLSQSVGKHFWVDVERMAIFPVRVPRRMNPWACMFYDADQPTRRSCLIGCEDGYIRAHDINSVTDELASFDSYVLIGPVTLADGYNAGILMELIPTLAKNSGDVAWSVYADDSEEDAVTRARAGLLPDASGTWTAGPGFTDHPVSRGKCFVLRIDSIERRWAMEGVSFTRRAAGKLLRV